MPRLQLFPPEKVLVDCDYPMAQMQCVARAGPLPDRQDMSPEHAQILEKLQDGVHAAATREVDLSLGPARNSLLVAKSLISSALHMHHTCNGESQICRSADWSNLVIWLDNAAGTAQNKADPVASPCLINTHHSQLMPSRCVHIAQHGGSWHGLEMLGHSPLS